MCAVVNIVLQTRSAVLKREDVARKRGKRSWYPASMPSALTTPQSEGISLLFSYLKTLYFSLHLLFSIY